jgi:hypothetical protein
LTREAKLGRASGRRRRTAAGKTVIGEKAIIGEETTINKKTIIGEKWLLKLLNRPLKNLLSANVGLR